MGAGIFSLHLPKKFNHMIGKSTIRGMVWESDVIFVLSVSPSSPNNSWLVEFF